MGRVGRASWPSRRDGNAALAFALVVGSLGAVGFVASWLWQTHNATLWVVAACLVVVVIGFTVLDTWADIRDVEREAREKRAARTQERFLQHLRDELPGEPGTADP